MTTSPGVLTLLTDSLLRDELDRVAAAVGIGVAHLSPTAVVGRKAWVAAAAVVLDEHGAQHCAHAALPRRAAVYVLAPDGPVDPPQTTYQAAISVGAQRVLNLPAQAGDLVAELAGAGDHRSDAADRGVVLAVIGGRGGAGASLFATALAQAATTALIIDLDPWSGGLDLLLGTETASGLRWPDLALKAGRLNWTAVREALPRQRSISVLSAARRGHDLDGDAVDAVIEAGRRGGATVVCDLPRCLTDAVLVALDSADLVVVISPCDVRSCAATAAVAPVLTARNPNIGLVVRGPSPGGLRAADVADIAALPLLATMRPEPVLGEKLEQGGLRLSRRSPLARAAEQVLAICGHRPGYRAEAVA